MDVRIAADLEKIFEPGRLSAPKRTGGLHAVTLDSANSQQLLDRFLRYVKVDTRSDEASEIEPDHRETEGPLADARRGAQGPRLLRRRHDRVGLCLRHRAEQYPRGPPRLRQGAHHRSHRPRRHLFRHLGQRCQTADHRELLGRRHRHQRRPGAQGRRQPQSGQRSSATPSSTPTAPPCSAPTTRPASPRS